MSNITRRDFLRMMGTGITGVAAVACGIDIAAPVVAAASPAVPTHFSTVLSQGSGGKYKERPEFAKMVADGSLPAVDQRLPDNPNVMSNDEIGAYGGTLYVASPFFGYTYEQEAFTINNDANTIVPEYAESYEWNGDKTVFTMHLRKGIKWSDGEPFTTQDFVFFYDYVINDKDVNPGGPWISGQRAALKAIDDYTLQFTWTEPNPSYLSELANWSSSQGQIYDAQHYLSKYHLKLNPDADKVAQAEGFDTWAKCLFSHLSDATRNGVPNAPLIGPFIPVTWTSSTHTYQANPYFYSVDTEGNQLPYFWQIVSAEGLADEVKLAQGLAGQVNWLQNLNLSDINVLQDNAEKGEYRVIMLKKGVSSTSAIGFNQSHKNPVLAQLFQDVRFRQAMAASINRDEINQVIYLGTATPQAATPSPACSFYKSEWAQANATYDVDMASQLLDQVGLQWDTDHKYRLAPDGSQLIINWQYRPEFPQAEAELIKDYFDKVGIQVNLKEIDRGLFYEALSGNNLDMGVWDVDRIEPIRISVPWTIKWVPWSETSWGAGWQTWWQNQGSSGDAPPEKYQQILATMGKWYTETDDTKANALAQEVFDFFAQDCTLIGTVAFPQVPHILSNKVANGPQNGSWFGDGVNWYKTFKLETWFFKS
jgi:peptide/nickel transport system substrate-binding protein